MSHFYNTIDVKPETFNDIKQRLIQQELDWKYILTDDEGREVIVFGTTGLRAEIE